jgi:hypothetical protein
MQVFLCGLRSFLTEDQFQDFHVTISSSQGGRKRMSPFAAELFSQFDWNWVGHEVSKPGKADDLCEIVRERIPRFGLEINETRDIIKSVTMMRTTRCSKQATQDGASCERNNVTPFE